MVDAYYFCVGGALGLHQATARPVGYRCAATEVPDALERLLSSYLVQRERGKICAVFWSPQRHPVTRVSSWRSRARSSSRLDGPVQGRDRITAGGVRRNR